MDAHDAINARVSTRAFKPDPVPRPVIERLLAAAVRAPNHKLTEPWRFAVLTGASALRFAERKRAHRATRFPDPAAPEAAKAIDKTFREARGTPAFVVVLGAESEDPVRREEDYAATMMATENLLVAATAEGLGTYVRTGGIMRDPAVRELVRAPETHRIVAIVSLGYPAEAVRPGRRSDPAERTVWLD
ncbi:MAG TPA: nitroreductase [Gemmatimonadales bacterium]|nr:nitroreductase [Gemmatimonadales bacterium]